MDAGTARRARVAWLAAAALVGTGVGVLWAWSARPTVAQRGDPPAATMLLRAGAPAARPPARPVPAASGSPHAAAAVASYVNAAAIDDAVLISLARDEFGADCDSIVERGPQAANYFDIVCAGGERLRVYFIDGGLPRIGPPEF